MIKSEDVLYLDIGSSFIKVKYKDNYYYLDSPDNLSQITKNTNTVIYSSVRTESSTNKILSNVNIQNKLIRPYDILKNKLETRYDISLLGEDRGLSILWAIFRKFYPIAIIDAGTAVTVDLINDNGIHLGGFIFPGISYSLKNLLKSKNFKIDNENINFDKIPVNTSQALNSYDYIITAGINALLMKLNFQKENIIISGGDQNYLKKYLDDFSEVDNIVLTSLEYFLSSGLIC